MEEQAAFTFAVDPNLDEIAQLTAEIRRRWKPHDYERAATAVTRVRLPVVKTSELEQDT